MEDILEKSFNILDFKLFDDVQNYRKHDSHKILKRLDAVHKNYRKPVDTDGRTIQQFLKCLITAYCSCIETIKIARSVEKFLDPWKADYRLFIQEELGKFIDGVTTTCNPDSSSLVAVSNLLEQNILVQEIVERQLVSFLTWLTNHLHSLVKKTPTELSTQQASCLYAYVKIALQLFQSCCKKSCRELWSDKHGDSVKLIKNIIQDVYTILVKEDYASDCVQLAGTTFGLVLVAAPDPFSSVCAFWSTFKSINHADAEINVAEFKNKEVLEQTISHVHQTLGGLSLVKGFVVCCNRGIISYHNKTKCGMNGGNIFFITLFPVICSYCSGPIGLHYHAFSLLQSWFRKFVAVLSDLEICKLVESLSDIFNKTLNLVFLNWDSPVEDVPDIVGDVFRLMLQCWQISDIKENDIPGQVLQKLMNTPWYIKGKYRILAVVLTFVEHKQILDKNPGIKQQLLQCLSKNYLASCASDVYKAFLQHIKKVKDSKNWIDLWKHSWQETVIQGLVHSDSLVRSNVNHYWVQSTMKVLPPVGEYLQEYLSELLQLRETGMPRQRLLHAWVVVSKVIRVQTGTEVKETDLLREALYSASEDIRADAIGLLCCSLKKAEPLSERDQNLLRDILPENLKVDSAPFRQHLTANSKKLLVRVRDSCLSMLKAKNFTELDKSLDFIEWLQDVCMSNILPGASFQRRKACLEVLGVIFDTFTYQEAAKQRKSYTPESIQLLRQYVDQKKIWDFYSFDNTVCLLHCVSDGADEIQELAGELLMSYFPCPLSPDNEPTQKASHLLSNALTLCNSPKAHESMSGALLCKIVFTKYVVDLCWIFDMKLVKSEFCCSVVEGCDGSQSPAVRFLSSLLEFIQGTLHTSKSNIVQASKESPIHGLVTACTRCLTETPGIFTNVKHHQDMDQVVIELLTVNMDIIRTMLMVMARDSENEACPSFAEIGVAMETWISENQSEYTESTSLSTEHQYLLSWCWINIKESCFSLGQLIVLLMHENQEVDLSLVKEISTVFLQVLTQCRHRGVIEGCRLAFNSFCTALFDSVNPHFSQLPEQILHQAIDTLESKATTTSVTRKSAGLPIVIQTIVSCEKKYKRTVLLQFALDELFRVAALPLNQELDDKHDLPQIHGLNILNSLYGDASITASLMPYIGLAVQVVVNSFSSPAWGIRNAATRLFSVLMTRIFGHKKTTGNSGNSITLHELSAHYAELPPFMLEHLTQALKTDLNAIDKLHPSLFPILTLLANLTPVDLSDMEKLSIISKLKNLVEQLIGSPVYYLRQLTAGAFVALIPVQMGFSTMEECLNAIPDTEPVHYKFNLIHGRLICIDKLLQLHKLSEEDSQIFLRKMLKKDWIINNISVCSLIKDIYLSVIMRVLHLSTPEQCKTVLDAVHSLQNTGMSGRNVVIGFSTLCKRVVQILFELQINKGDNPDRSLEKLLTHVDIEVKLTTVVELSKLLENENGDQYYWQKIQRLLMHSVTVENYPPLLDSCLSLITDIHMLFGTEKHTETMIKQFCKSRTWDIEDRGSVVARILALSAIGVKSDLLNENQRSDLDFLQHWCGQILKASTMTGDEHCRIATARGILMAGETVLTYVGLSRETTDVKQECAVRLVQACINLLQDDDTDVRNIAVKFLSGFQWPTKKITYPSVQCNSCFQLLMDYVCDTYWWSGGFVSLLVDMLYKPGDVKTVIERKLTSSHQQLFEQEDNNFFAEKIFNGFTISRTLHRMVKISEEQHSTAHTHIITDKVQKLCEDLQYIQTFLENHCKDKSVFNLCCEDSVLAALSGCLLLSGVCIKHLCCHADDVILAIRQHIIGIQKNPSLPPSFRNAVQPLIGS